MKKTLFLTLIAAIFILTSCKKEDSIMDVITGNSSKSSSLSGELADLYQQVPSYDFGKISLVNGDILQFQSKEHFADVYKYLLDQYEVWTELFMKKYDTDDEDELDKIIEDLGFDDCTPLLKFEEYYNIAGNNLRTIHAQEEEKWLNSGIDELPPFDDIVICHVEQTLFSTFYEVCIGDTICQLRPDGYQILIPLSLITDLPEIRITPTAALAPLSSKIGLVIIPPAASTCYKSGHKIGDYAGNRIISGTRYRFQWSYNFRITWLDHAKTTVTMKNYKWKKNKNKWVSDNAVCALGFNTKLYAESQGCFFRHWVGVPKNTPQKAYSRTKTKMGDIDIMPQGYLRDDTNSSEILCRHYGENFDFVAETGQRKN